MALRIRNSKATPARCPQDMVALGVAQLCRGPGATPPRTAACSCAIGGLVSVQSLRSPGGVCGPLSCVLLALSCRPAHPTSWAGHSFALGQSPFRPQGLTALSFRVGSPSGRIDVVVRDRFGLRGVEGGRLVHLRQRLTPIRGAMSIRLQVVTSRSALLPEGGPARPRARQQFSWSARPSTPAAGRPSAASSCRHRRRGCAGRSCSVRPPAGRPARAGQPDRRRA